MQTIKQTIITIIICMAVVAGVSLVSAWTGPLQAPPGCTSGDPGCDAPINVSASAQTLIGSKILNVKSDGTGSLGINGALTVNGLGVFNGNVGIGTAAPGTNKLQVNGKIQAIGGDICTDQGGDGGKCLSAQGGGDGNITYFGNVGVVLKEGVAISAECHVKVIGSWCANGGAKKTGGSIYTRVFSSCNDPCDSGWILGTSAHCGKGNSDLYATTNADGVFAENRDRSYPCSARTTWGGW